ncbi:MAG: exodeoxyribonuclease V subunit alpha [Deltaproteobacteria bacterium]|nr:exodeoxyribonuclease V subunit alpha [Deltaproteobacteria bacterium]
MSIEMGEKDQISGVSGWFGRRNGSAAEGYLQALLASVEAAAKTGEAEVSAVSEEGAEEASAPEPLEQNHLAAIKQVWTLAVAACSAMGVRDPRLVHVVAEVIAAPMRGSTAVSLEELAERVASKQAPTGGAWQTISAAALRTLLATSCLVESEPSPSNRPLLLVEGKLVSRLMYDAHLTVRERWRHRDPLPAVDDAKIKIDAGDTNSSSQSEAVRKVKEGHRNIILTGGPGTGKTTTIGRIVNLCVLAGKRVALAAPTGRAQARMFQALLEQANAKPANPAEKAMFKGTTSEEVSEAFRTALQSGTVKPTTIHRLLGIHGGVTAGRGRDNPIAADVVIVDEASMVDLTLMAKLVAALPEKAQLVLVGDPNQLASVEAGSVLGDLIAAQESSETERSQTIKLAVVHRTEDGSKIRTLADVSLGQNATDRDKMLVDSVEKAAESEAAAMIVETKFTALTDADWKLLSKPFVALRKAAEALPATAEAAEFDREVSDLLKVPLNAARVLCLHRAGKFGSVKANERIGGEVAVTKGWSAGKPIVGQPVMATQNNNLLGIFNGDLGLCVRRDEVDVFAFERPVSDAGSDAGVNYVSPAQVPGWEPAFATTVHKAQGSQAENVVVLLPDEPSRLCTREGLYTGITRAKKQVLVIGPREVFDACVARVTERTSLLPEMLRG